MRWMIIEKAGLHCIQEMSSICNVRAFIVYWMIRQEEAAGMQEIKVPIGRSGFADIRKNGYYYIDKSGLIRECSGQTEDR